MLARSPRQSFGAFALLAAVAISVPAMAQDADHPAIPGYGGIAPIAGYAEQPDPTLRYRVVFAVSGASGDAKDTNGALERVARYLNILAAGGVHPQKGDIVAIVFGPATAIVAKDEIYAAKAGAPKNPNLALIAALQSAGVTVAVCGQALAGHKMAPSDLAPGVRVDASAITTITTLQLRGYAYLPD